MSVIGFALAEQYDRAWAMLRATMERFPDEQWNAGDAPGQVPARWALHAVETVDFYLRAAPDGFPWGERCGVSSGADAALLPHRQVVLQYLDEVRASSVAWLRAASDDDLLTAANAFPWTGATVLGRMLYTLRHTMTHQGELSMLLRLHGAEETEWR